MISKLLSFGALFSLLVFACNPKKEIAPKNPCEGYIQPHADFIIEQGILNDWYRSIYILKDTVMIGIKIQFRSEFADTSEYKHTWYIGNEVLHNYKEWRDFNDVQRPQNITIIHVMKWKPDKFCNPKDDGYDSVSFTFKLANYYKDCIAFNKYRMVYDSLGANNKDSIDIEFYFSKPTYKDSIISNYRFEDRRNFISADVRLKGLKLFDYAFNEWDASEKFALDWGIISNSFLYLNRSGNSQIRELRLDLLKNGAEMSFVSYNKKIKLKGRIL